MYCDKNTTNIDDIGKRKKKSLKFWVIKYVPFECRFTKLGAIKYSKFSMTTIATSMPKSHTIFFFKIYPTFSVKKNINFLPLNFFFLL